MVAGERGTVLIRWKVRRLAHLPPPTEVPAGRGGGTCVASPLGQGLCFQNFSRPRFLFIMFYLSEE